MLCPTHSKRFWLSLRLPGLACRVIPSRTPAALEAQGLPRLNSYPRLWAELRRDPVDATSLTKTLAEYGWLIPVKAWRRDTAARHSGATSNCSSHHLGRQDAINAALRPLRSSASDTPCARQRGAWFQPDQSVLGSKCVRRTRHRFDGKTATVEVRKGVATENHEVRVALVDPERDLHSAVRISKLHTSEAILIALKVSERMVEPRRADPPRLLKIVLGAAPRCP